MSDPELVTRDGCRKVVEASFNHLVRLVRPDGKFVYAHPIGQPDKPLEGYNLLRHCGTLWFMLRALDEMQLEPTAEVRDALARSVFYIAGLLERPAWIDPPSLALVSGGGQIKTGGIGLALCMLEAYRRGLSRGLDPTALPLGLEETISGLQTYALAQIEGGDFHHKRDLAEGTVLPFHSDFYTGEALLGLFLTGCTDETMLAATETLVARRYGVPEQSHWMAYASCEAAARGLVAETRITGYITDLMTGIIGNAAYRWRAKSTPIACRSEALTRFMQLCDQWPGRFPESLREQAFWATQENLSLQLVWYQDGQFRKGFDDDTVQIDYIQHNATAFLNLWHCLPA
jgi:hypothetical protein